jgi:branched-subunit amino acid ABC-type transport system permease component
MKTILLSIAVLGALGALFGALLAAALLGLRLAYASHQHYRQ